MRLRNITGASEIVQNSKYIINDLNNIKGNLSKIFSNNNPICIEIGMGKGNFIINMAKNNPNINYIGIEKYPTVMLSAVKKLEHIEISNLKLIVMDANEIEKYIDKEIDTIYLNFSDPWPKTRHAKRRLSSSNFLKKYDNLFKENKHIIMKTDNRKLFEFSVMEFTNYGYKINDISLHLHQDTYPDNIPTEYEIKFSSKGFPIYRIDITKK